jgi:Tfp pilus assembly protein PilV
MKYKTRKIKNKKCYKGSSFVEVMFSVFLVSVGITTAISLITLGIKNSTENRRQLVAAMLSQEGIELVRNIRDTNAKTNSDSFNGIAEGFYIINYNDNPLSLNSSGNAKLKYFSSTGFYNHNSGVNSQFSRKIAITGTGEQRSVYSTVTWEDSPFLLASDIIPTELICNLASKCTFTKIMLNRWRE